jgi:glutamate/tyrosine decarboxylase-like PLP-dependent enzyme
MPSPRGAFDWSSATREEVGLAALRIVLDWFDTIGERRLYPDVGASALESRLSSPLPRAPQAPAAILGELQAHVLPGLRDNGHPRMFGYVQSSGTFVGALGDFLASAVNANVTSWRSAPSGTTIERQVIGWMKEMSGFDPGGDGLLVSGGSMANLVAMVAATAAAHPDVPRRGVRALAGEPVIYASAAVHMSIPKAAAIAGLGRGAVRTLPADAEHRLDPAALDRAIAEDRRAGRVPICAVANVGDVNTGAIDPLEAVADVCARHGVWLHGDGAYGGFARLAPSAADALKGIGRLDSLALDPHKWLFVPVDSGCVLVRDAAALRRAFSYAADYVDVIAAPGTSEYAFWDYGPELTRRFRALKIWMALKACGVEAIAAAIEGNIRLARRLASLIDASDDFERLAPVPLSIVTFRYVRGGGDLNARNRTLMLAVQHGGRSYLSNAMLGDAFALRVCIVNHRTTEDDLRILLDEIRERAEADLTQSR